MQKISFILLLLVLCIPNNIKAQGCSDAGFCSLSNLKSNATVSDSANHNAISLGIGYGQGFEQTQYLNPYIEYGRKLCRGINIQAKLTTAYASGFAGQNFDAGDLFIVGSYSGIEKEKSQWSFLLGAKVPLNNANNTNSDKVVLPLDYQSSIGTYDFIAGVNLSLKKHWEFNAGFQAPVINSNENTFSPSDFTDERIKKFAPTNGFKRKPDALVRAGYVLNVLKTKWKLKPNLLAIYHFGNDSYENTNGQTVEIKNSEGLTVNGGLMATYLFKNQNQLELLAAMPFVVREVRPDGLTRSVVFNVQYKIVF